MSFFDHFSGSSLDARWTGVTAASGTNTVSGSVLRIQRPAGGDAAYVYYNTKLDKTTDQIWFICSNMVNTAGWRRPWQIRNTTTPGTPLAFSDANTVLGCQVAFPNPTYNLVLDKYDTGAARTAWNEVAAAWQNPASVYGTINTVGLNNYTVSGFEIDATNARVRTFVFGAYTGSFTSDQGSKLMQLSDWVSWSALNTAQTDLYLYLGVPWTNAMSSDDNRFEWVRMENGTKRHAWGNGRSTGTGVYDIRHWWDYGGGSFMPEDRSTIAVAKGTAGAWDDDHVKDAFVIKDGSTYYMFYDGYDGSIYQIGLATASSPNGPWTKDGGNPVLSAGAGGEGMVFFPYIVVDDADADSNKRWKMIYVGFGAGVYHLYYAYAAAAAGPWTRVGVALSVGGAGDFDELIVNNPCILWHNGQWEVWYCGGDTDPVSGENVFQVGRATGTSLASLTKDGAGARITWQGNGVEVATATVTGRTVSMTDTTGFTVDGTVVMSTANTQDDWSISKIRAITANTSLELYHAVATASAPAVAQVDAWRGLGLHHIENVAGTWYFYAFAFRSMNWNASYNSSCETAVLFTHTGTHPADATPTMNITQHPLLPLTEFGWDVSSENITLATTPVYAGESFPGGFIHPIHSTLLRM